MTGKTLSPSESGGVLEPVDGDPGGTPNVAIDFLSDIPVTLSAVLGRTRIAIRELLELGVGSVVELDRPVGESLDLNVNGSPFGKVDVTVIEDTYGLRISEIINPFAS
ncbi:MAG: flagellar motor switch protein FliN [Candidatus Coatesbacteria bacterium]|nr:flagellar motor switch protein FliN [Candidatus Coatesbacteria bacterium]